MNGGQVPETSAQPCNPAKGSSLQAEGPALLRANLGTLKEQQDGPPSGCPDAEVLSILTGALPAFGASREGRARAFLGAGEGDMVGTEEKPFLPVTPPGWLPSSEAALMGVTWP